MIGKVGIWAGLAVVIVVALMFGGPVANAATVSPPPPVTTYTVWITQSGMPSTQTWTATLNGVTDSGHGATQKFTGVAAGSYYLYTPTVTSSGSTYTQYVSLAGYTYITVPNQLAVTMSYTTQYYTTFAVSPSGSGTAYPGTGWYDAGTEVAISEQAATGYSFSKWTDAPSASFTVANTKAAATEALIKGVGTLTSTFKSSTTAGTFDESGLPSSTSWSVTFDSAGSSSTTGSLTTAKHTAGNYYWTVAPVSSTSTVQYAPNPASGYMNLPYQSTQEIVFTEQIQVTFASTPSSTGSTSPTGTAFYNAGSQFPIVALNSASWVFSKWSGNESKVGLGSTSNAGTNATVKSSTTITATFKSGTECTTCSLTYTEIGLPSGTSWGITFGSANYVSSTTSVSLSGITASASWSAFEPVGAGQFEVAYIPAYIGTTYTGSGYWGLGTTSHIEIVYQEYAWVTFTINPTYTGGATLATGWYPVDSVNPLSAVGTAYWSFSSWTSSGHNVTLGSSSASSTTLTVTGPGTITVNFNQATETLHFMEFGLPTGTTWGVQLNSPTGVWYTSHTQYLNITGVALGGYGWSALSSIYAGTSGMLWVPWSYYGSVTLPFTTYESVVYSEQAYLSFATSSNPSGGTTAPSASAYYWVGTVLPIMASNGSASPFFNSWSDTAGTGTISSTSSPATFVTVAGTGTVTAKF
jgi:hypothetical protein